MACGALGIAPTSERCIRKDVVPCGASDNDSLGRLRDTIQDRGNEDRGRDDKERTTGFVASDWSHRVVIHRKYHRIAPSRFYCWSRFIMLTCTVLGISDMWDSLDRPLLAPSLSSTAPTRPHFSAQRFRLQSHSSSTPQNPSLKLDSISCVRCLGMASSEVSGGMGFRI